MTDLSTNEARMALVKKYATKHLLDSALVAALVEHESSWNTWAVRYEPAFFAHYIEPMHLTDTQGTLRSTSFGLGQIMGQTAIELGFKGKWLTELCDPEVGLEFACRKLAKCIDKHPGDVNAALLAYNGGGDPSYPASVIALMPKYY